MNEIYKENPCHGCEKPVRHPGCHASCEKHAEWQRNLHTKQDQVYEEKNKVSRLDSYEKDMAVKRKKRMGKGKV